MTTRVEIATTDNAFFKLLEVPLPLTHRSLLDAAQKKFRSVTKQSRLFDGISGEELVADAVVELARGAKIMVSGKSGWKGAEWLRAERAAKGLPAADSGAVAPLADDREPENLSARRVAAPLRLQLVSFSYDLGQPPDTKANIDARGLLNPGKAAMGRTGLDKRLAKEVLASAGAGELCEQIIHEALHQVQDYYETTADGGGGASTEDGLAAVEAGADAGSSAYVRVGVGCDRGLHRSVALAEAATARLVRKAEHARSGRNCPGLEVLLRRVQLVDVDHRELAAQRSHTDGAGTVEVEEVQLAAVDERMERRWRAGGVDRRAELRIVGGV